MLTRILATLGILTGLILGAGLANAEPCKMAIGNGQYAPCPPPIISTGPGTAELGTPYVEETPAPKPEKKKEEPVEEKPAEPETPPTEEPEEPVEETPGQ